MSGLQGVILDNATIRAALRAVGVLQDPFETKQYIQTLDQGWFMYWSDWRSARMTVFEHDLTALANLVESIVLSDKLYYLPYQNNPHFWASRISNSEHKELLYILTAIKLLEEEKIQIEDLAKRKFLHWASPNNLLVLTGKLLEVISIATSTYKKQTLAYASSMWPLVETYWHMDERFNATKLFERLLRIELRSDSRWPAVGRSKSRFTSPDEAVIWLAYQAIFYKYLGAFKKLAYSPHPARGRLVLYDLFVETELWHGSETVVKAVLNEINSWVTKVKSKNIGTNSIISPFQIPPLFFYVVTLSESADQIIPNAIKLRAEPSVQALRQKLKFIEHCNDTREINAFMKSISKTCERVTTSLGLKSMSSELDLELSLLFIKFNLKIPIGIPTWCLRKWHWGQKHIAFIRDVTKVNMVVNSIGPYYDKIFGPILKHNYLKE